MNAQRKQSRRNLPSRRQALHVETIEPSAEKPKTHAVSPPYSLAYCERALSEKTWENHNTNIKTQDVGRTTSRLMRLNVNGIILMFK